MVKAWTYQVIVNTLVELPLGRAALPKLLVSVVEAFPVLAELGQAVCVDIREPMCPRSSVPLLHKQVAHTTACVPALVDCPPPTQIARENCL